MNEPQSPSLSIVIVSYNVKDLLLECLSSIQKFVSVSHEVLVVDNDSRDDTAAAVRQQFPNVILVENKFNAGFSAANNQAFAMARGEYILMLNPDASFIDSSFYNAFDYLRSRNENILLGPRILNPNKSFQSSAWKFPNAAQHFLEAIFLNRFVDLISYPNTQTAQEPMKVDFISGAAILAKKETIQKLGGLDTDLFWMDDTDLCYRNQLQGGETIYFPQWQIIHHIGQSSAKNLRIVISNQIISKLKFYQKHKRYFSFFLSLLIFLLHILLRIVFLLPASLASKKAFAKWKAYLYSFGKLFRFLFAGDRSVA